MLEKHRTKDGTTMLIAQMDDQHLINMINSMLRKVQEAQRASQNMDKATAFQRRLYNLPEVTEEEVADVTRAVIQGLYPYLAEAYLRDLPGPRLALVEILGRSDAIAMGVPLLEAVNGYNLFPDTELP
jgi:hypothetical protein